MRIILIILAFYSSFTLAADCSKQDQSLNMCKGQGYCTYYPIAAEGDPCPSKWEIPDGWVAMDLDCLSNTKIEGSFSCKDGGKITIAICGKSNCYKCQCN